MCVMNKYEMLGICCMGESQNIHSVYLRYCVQNNLVNVQVLTALFGSDICTEPDLT